jgi:hypothetical protein
VGRNVAEDVDPLQIKCEEMRPLNWDQTRALLKAAEGNRLEALYVVWPDYRLVPKYVQELLYRPLCRAEASRS